MSPDAERFFQRIGIAPTVSEVTLVEEVLKFANSSTDEEKITARTKAKVQAFLDVFSQELRGDARDPIAPGFHQAIMDAIELAKKKSEAK